MANNNRLSKQEVKELIEQELMRRKSEKTETSQKKRFQIINTKERLTKDEVQQLIDNELYRRRQARLALEAEKDKKNKKTLIICAVTLAVLFIIMLIGSYFESKEPATVTEPSSGAAAAETSSEPIATADPTPQSTPKQTNFSQAMDPPEIKLERAMDSADVIISRYNDNDPPVKIGSIQNIDRGWSTTTIASYGDYQIEFAESDGWPCYLLSSAMGYNEVNTAMFLEEANRFLHALYPGATDSQIDAVIERFKTGETHVTDLVKGDLISYRAEETEFDGYYYSVYVSDFIA